MKKLILFLGLLLSAVTALADYTSGVWILNEDWYGHNNSTINMWYPEYGYCDYLVAQNENPGVELGCTAQFGQIFGGRIYIMAKQDVDPGVSDSGVESGRLVILDAATMKVINVISAFELNDSGKSIADGRACCGVDENKMYIGTSNGIYVFDINTGNIMKRIEGTENELITGNEDNADGQGALYQNQIGMMIRGQDYVFAVKQDEGILVIDPFTDTVVSVIKGCFSTMVQSADGNIWVGMNVAEGENDSGVSYQHYPYGNNGDAWLGTSLMCIDQYTLETRVVDLDEGGVPQSWYAWTAGTLAASAKRNVLYFTYSDPSLGQIGWFTNSMLYCYDIDSDNVSAIYDSRNDGIYFYSSSMRVNPVDDMIYAHLYVGSNIATQDWVYMILDSDGKEQAMFQPIKRYWYPAMFIFPDNESPQVVGMPSSVEVGEEPVIIDLSDKVIDADTPVASIVKRVASNSNVEYVDAKIIAGRLILTAVSPGVSEITVKFDSNGRIVNHSLTVRSTAYSGIGNVRMDNDSYSVITVYTPLGVKVRTVYGVVDDAVNGLPSGIYIISKNGKQTKIYIK